MVHPSIKPKMIKLGTGVLNWDRGERITDRYGVVYLLFFPGGREKVPLCGPKKGHRGSLIAIVKETRQSTHIGDFFDGVEPRTPEVGQVITLGTGKLFYENNGGVGLRPDDGRETRWLDIRALYDVHEQTVDLFFQKET